MSESNVRYQLRLPISEPRDLVAPAEPLNVYVNLSRLLREDLTFNGEKTDSATHRLHAFAAKFPPQLPRLFINQLTHPGDWVLDPMCGSGTTLVEAVLADRHAVGIDLDPLAVLVAYIKCLPLDLACCVNAGANVLGHARKRLHSVSMDELTQWYKPEAINFFNYWFEARTIRELFALIQEIQAVDDVEIRTFLKVVFSSAIITKHGTLTRARDLAHSRPHRDVNKKVTDNAIDFFEERLSQAIQIMQTVAGARRIAMVARSDARSLPLADNSIDLIVTSPPYAANAIDYMRANKFSLMWFGEEPKGLTKLRGKYIGAELRTENLEFLSDTANRVMRRLKREREVRAAVVGHYYRDMETALHEMLRVLREERAAVLVVGSSVIQGVDILAPTVLAELAPTIGFRLVGVARREILRNARMMPTSHNSKKSGIEARMHEEGVIGLVKPQVNRNR